MTFVGKTLLTAALMATSFGIASLPASAKTAYEMVTVTGDFRDQKITAPVRVTDAGRQVRAPHGAWIDCPAADCKKALKDATFDFWQIQEDDGGGR